MPMPSKRKQAYPQKDYGVKKIKRGMGYISPKVTQPIQAFVRKAIQKAAEKKVFVGYAVNQTIGCASGTTPISQYLLPQLSQGTTNSTRIGNKIKVSKAYVQGYVNLLPYNATTNPQPLPAKVRIWVCQNRNINTNNLSSTTISSDFFEVTSGNVGFQGNMLDMVLTNNNDNWIIYGDKIADLGVTGVTATGPVSTGSYADNSKFSMPFYFDITKAMGTIIFQDASTTPVNKNLWLVFQVVNADGSTDGTYVIAEYHYTSRVEYTDL